MPEITILTGLRDTKGGASEADGQLLKSYRQEQRIQLWTAEGTDEECEASWRTFLLADMPDGVIYS